MARIKKYDEDDLHVSKRDNSTIHKKNTRTPVFYKSSSNKYNNSNKNNSKSVLVKVTSHIKTVKGLKDKIDYDIRNGNENIDLKNSDGEVIPPNFVFDSLSSIIESDINCREGSSKAYRMVFSFKDKTDPDSLQKAVNATMNSLANGYEYYTALHQDTDNNHVHVTVLRKSETIDKRFELNKSKLESLKVKFAEELKKQGVDAEYISKKTYQKIEDDLIYKDKKRNTYIIKDYGVDNYNFDSNQNKSFFLKVETTSGKEKIYWSKGLAKNLMDAKAQVGDEITLSRKERDKDDVFSLSDWNLNVNRKKEDMIKFFKIDGFESAQYRRQEKGKKSFVMKLIDEDGNKKEIWSKNLADYVVKLDLDKGDILKFDLSQKNIQVEKASDNDFKIKNEQKKQTGIKI
ncbi:relaxase/mobilization nuclease domain-containing protein [Providencia alcalifaciens]|uniref:relaxase/mobilization nuclease domain-containing protein n=1 Tax=Providencia alcalifaciens TaxID=126385 RepID=UPI0032D9C214